MILFQFHILDIREGKSLSDKSFESNLTIFMKKEFISIPEIIIKNQIPQEIINRTLRAIGRNYGNYTCLNDRFLQGRSYEKI